MSMIGIPSPRRRGTMPLVAAAAAAVTALVAAGFPVAATAHGAMAAMGNDATLVRVTAPAITVMIDHHAFLPAKIEIAAGTTVTWKNADDTPHTVRARNQAFASSALDNGDSFVHAFAAPGDYAYYCSLHPFMVGEIVVEPAGRP